MRAATTAKATSRSLLAATYLLAFFAPSQALSVPATVALSADTPYVDYQVTLDGDTLFYVTASAGQDCAGWDFAEHVDPYLILFNDTGELARDDDGNFAETGGLCYSAKLNLTPPAGTYTLRVSSYQHETNMTVPTGSVTLGWSQDGYQPPTTTTTTTTTSSTTTTTTTQPAATTSTTLQPSSTTTTSTTTTAAPSTTTSTTSTSTTSTTTTTTTTTAPPTTTVPPTTSTTTSSTLPPPPSTLPPTSTTRPPATTTSTTTTSTTTTSTTTTTTTAPPTTSTAAPTTTQAPPTTTEPPRLTEALTVAAAIPDEALAAAVIDVIAAEPDDIAVEDVRELVEQPAFDDLEPVQLAAVAAAINDAPVEAKQEFESAESVANAMFSPALQDYTRSDSTIPQSERKTVVAVVAAGAVLAVPRSATPSPSTTGSPARRNQT